MILPYTAVFIRKDGYPLNGQQQQEPSFHDAFKWSSETLNIYVYLFPAAGFIFSSAAGAWTKVECTRVLPHAVICDVRLQCVVHKFGAGILHSFHCPLLSLL